MAVMVVVVVDGDMLARRGVGTTLGGLVRIRKGTLWPLHAWVCVDGYMAWMLSQHRTLSTSDSTARAAVGPRPGERRRWWEEDEKERARYRPVQGFISHIASGLGVSARHGTTTSSGAHGSQPLADPERSHGRG